MKKIEEQVGVQQEKEEVYTIGPFDIRRLSGDTLCAVIDGTFVKVDLHSGKVVKHTGNLVRNRKSFAYISPFSTKEGIYYITDNRIRLISWEGQVRDLGPAKLE